MENNASHETAVCAEAGWTIFTSEIKPVSGDTPLDAQASAEAPALARLRCGFRAHNLRLLVRANTPTEVLLAPITPHGEGPAWLLGILNLRDVPVPVIDLKRALDLGVESNRAAHPFILVLDKRDKALGLVVEGFSMLARPRRLAKLPRLPNILKSHISAAYAADDEVWLEFDHEGFLESLS